MFCNTKDSISVEQKSNVIYRITCPDCFQKYVSMLIKPIKTSSPDLMDIVKKLTSHNCSEFNEHIMLFTLPDTPPDTTIVSKELHLHNTVINNINILDKSDNI